MWGRARARRSRAVKWGRRRGEEQGKMARGGKARSQMGTPSMMVKDPSFKRG